MLPLPFVLSLHTAYAPATIAPFPGSRLTSRQLFMCAAAVDEEEEDLKAKARQRELDLLKGSAEQWLAMSCAISLSETQELQPFSVPQGWMGSMSPPPAQEYTREQLVEEIEKREPSLYELLDACAERAPSLCTRSHMLPLARLAAWTDRDEWVRPLDEWTGDGFAGLHEWPEESEEEAEAREAAALRGLTAHLLEKWDVPQALDGALAYRDGPPTSEAAHRIAKAFVAVHAVAGRGDSSVLNMLREVVAPDISKAAAKAFTRAPTDGAIEDNPLQALRRAQVAGLGGEAWVGEAACESRLGRQILRVGEPSEEFALVALDWVCRHQDQLAQERIASTLDYLIEMRAIDKEYTCVGRTPKTVRAALEAYAASTISFREEQDELFQPNPRGIKPLFELGAKIPRGTVVRVPYDGVYELEAGTKPATVRVAEILSLRRLFYEGEQLFNCLEGNRRSQGKYLSRVRERVSSFWSLTKQEEGGPVEHLCLIEVWHMGNGNEIRQAEGPRPRTIPGVEAWYWMDQWCKREGVDLSTWDCYS